LQAQEIHCDGLRTINDLWSLNDEGFRYWEEIRDRFGLDPNEQCDWNRALESMPTIWVKELVAPKKEVSKGEQIGIY
jgi:hypothetical protein